MSEEPQMFCQVCVCGRSVSDIAAFTKHSKSCQKGKKRLLNALTHVKKMYHSKKRRMDSDFNETECSPPTFEDGGLNSAEDSGYLGRAEQVIQLGFIG
jgi:hypothetical protein